MPDLSTRIDRPEIMDSVTLDPHVVRRTLNFLGMTARHFGGADVIIDKLAAWTSRLPENREFSVLDVGTGGAEIPVAIARWARRTGRRVNVLAVDLVPEIAAIARENAREYPEIEVRCGDAFDLRAAGATFDFVTASLFLHHVPTPRITDMLRLFDALARRGIVVSDLSRSGPSFWAVKALSLLTGNHVVRHDGPLSVQRSFTRSELRDFARQAGLHYLHAEPAPWFRLALSGEKS
jgi:2-polyprenyl-3-methyl-5-hydroxy-6-metoxy-1,4-benzoquinol methylase